MDWDRLFWLFTEEVSPFVRPRVLEAIANPGTEITFGEWRDKNGNGCLFAVAAAAALGIPVGKFKAWWPSLLIRKAARALGLTKNQVKQGIVLWDNDDGRQRFINRIREFLVEPVIRSATDTNQQTAESHVEVSA